MKLWKRASGALKDKNSIWIANLSRRTALRNPDIEAAVIKATSHDDSHVDYRNAQRVFAWIRMSPAYFRPFVYALYMRMERTKSWVVALKGLMLMHGVFCCKVPAVQKIGRLPFDLSNFKDGHLSPTKAWCFNAFVRVYFAFLDQKSAFMCSDFQERLGQRKETQIPQLLQELVRLQKLQDLLDLLIHIRPQGQGMNMSLVLEAMDCIIIEIFDIYSRICNGIARVLMRIYSAGKVEAEMALKVLQRATKQGEELCLYFEFCRDIGVLNASECPKVEKIPEEDFQELERIINGVSKTKEIDMGPEDENKDKAIVVRETEIQKKCGLRTIITDNWEVFDEDLVKVNIGESTYQDVGKYSVIEDPFAASLTCPALHVHGNPQESPDLISFL